MTGQDVGARYRGMEAALGRYKPSRGLGPEDHLDLQMEPVWGEEEPDL